MFKLSSYTAFYDALNFCFSLLSCAASLAVTEVEKWVIHLGSHLALEDPPLHGVGHGVGQKPLALGLKGPESYG